MLNNGNDIPKVEVYYQEQYHIYAVMTENSYFSDCYFISALKDEDVDHSFSAECVHNNLLMSYSPSFKRKHVFTTSISMPFVRAKSQTRCVVL